MCGYVHWALCLFDEHPPTKVQYILTPITKLLHNLTSSLLYVWWITCSFLPVWFAFYAYCFSIVGGSLKSRNFTACFTAVVVHMTIKNSKRGGWCVKRKTAGEWQSETWMKKEKRKKKKTAVNHPLYVCGQVLKFWSDPQTHTWIKGGRRFCVCICACVVVFLCMSLVSVCARVSA